MTSPFVSVTKTDLWKINSMLGAGFSEVYCLLQRSITKLTLTICSVQLIKRSVFGAVSFQKGFRFKLIPHDSGEIAHILS